MLKNKLSTQQINELCRQLHMTITTCKKALQAYTMAATNDSLQDFEHDYTTVIDILGQTPKIDFEKVYNFRKPKGDILVMLSYNEPLIMSIDPILTALIAGNTVHVRASSTSAQTLQAIWEPALSALPWLSDRLSILDGDYQEALNAIISMQAVYFFGSQHIAKKVAAECAQHLVEFWPETEGADFAIYTETADLSPSDFAQYIFPESFSHAGQICQRIQGIFVHDSQYNTLLQALTDNHAILNTQANAVSLPNSQQQKMRQGYETLVADEPTAHYLPGLTANSPSIISGISPGSPLCQEAYFLPTLWVIAYHLDDDLLEILCNRPSQFGCNIWTSNKKLVRDIAEKTRLTRITTNTHHIDIRQGEGWGGAQPTSFGGYMKWSHKFSNAYTIISD